MVVKYSEWPIVYSKALQNIHKYVCRDIWFENIPSDNCAIGYDGLNVYYLYVVKLKFKISAQKSKLAGRDFELFLNCHEKPDVFSFVTSFPVGFVDVAGDVLADGDVDELVGLADRVKDRVQV
jgi:hypothetical protein